MNEEENSIEQANEDNKSDKVRELKIDPEFKALIQPLSESEYKRLETSIRKDGCRDSIVGWKGKNLVIDGHHRKDICDKHNIPYNIIEMEFPDRESVKRWILKNQLSRRNLTRARQMYIIGKTYESQKKSVGGDRGNQYRTTTVEEAEMAEIAEQSNISAEVNCEPMPQVPEIGSTAEKVAEMFKVSPSTVKRDAEYANAVDIISENSLNVNRDIKFKILSGEIDMTIGEIIALAQEDEEKQQQRISQVLADPDTAKAKKPKKPEKSPEEKRTFRFNNFLREMEYLTDEQLDTIYVEVTRINGGKPPKDLFATPEEAKSRTIKQI